MTNAEAITALSEMRADYNCFDEKEEPYYCALSMAIAALGKDTGVPSRKGVFIPDITVEMFRNASLEGVEELMASGEMEDISLPSAQPEIIRCKDCKYVGTDATCCPVCNRAGMGLKPYHVYPDDYCSYAERKTDERSD